MTAFTPNTLRASAAERAFRTFSAKFPELLGIACFAALPVALDAKLLHLIRLNFFAEQLDFDEECAFLLSPLCVEIADGLYEILPEVRALLLRQLSPTHLEEMSRLLWAYTLSDAWSDNEQLCRAQQLTALNYVAPLEAKRWFELNPQLEGELNGSREWIVAMKAELAWQSAIARGQLYSSEGEAPAVELTEPSVTVFLSYAWADELAFVRRLQADLEAAGLNVWRDEMELPNRGEALIGELLSAIDKATHFIPIIGPRAIASPAVQQEWSYALRNCKSIIPIWRLGDTIPSYFARNLYFDFRSDQPGFDYAANLAALKQRLIRTAPTPGRLHVIGTFPVLPDDVIRRKEFDQLIEALWRDPSRRVSTINALHASAGLGKTVLAALVAQDCDTRRHFLDGVWWISVGRNVDILSLQREFARRLGDSDDALAREYVDVPRGAARLEALVGDRQLLIVLDDVWNAADAKAFLFPANHCRWLITTRSSSLASELGEAPRSNIALDYLTEAEGVALIAKALGLDSATDYPDRALHAEIVRELGGHPLAIATAAARLNPASGRYQRPQRLLEQFREYKAGKAPFGSIDNETQDRNLELSLFYSYDDLLAADRKRLRLLGAFAPEGSFSVEAAMAVWQDDREMAEAGLAQLVARSLLSRLGDGRYSQHVLLHAYVLALLKHEGEQSDARRRHFDYYATIYADEEENQGYLDPRRHDQITADFNNVLHGLDWAFAAAPAAACDLVNALEGSYLRFRQPAATRRVLLQNALEAARRVAYRTGEVRVLKALGDEHLQFAEYEAARARYEEARTIHVAMGDRLGEANTIRALGDVYLRLADYEMARAHYEQAWPIFAAIGDRLGQANTIRALGDVQLRLAEYEAARARYEEARPIYAAIGDRLGEANTIHALGDVHYMLDDYGAARARYEQARPFFAAIGDRLGEANTIRALGDVHYMLAEYEAARARYEEAWSIYAAIGDRLGEANTIRALGDVHMQLAGYEAARARYEEALPVYTGIGDRLGEANTLRALGDVHLRLGEYEAARARHEVALSIYESIGDRLGSANAIRSLGYAHLQLGEYEAARVRYEAALSAFAAIGAKQGEANILKALGDVHYRLNEYKAAQTSYEAALSLFVATGARQGEANTLKALGDVQLQQAEYEAAQAYYEQARTLYVDIGDRLSEAEITDAIADVQAALITDVIEDLQSTWSTQKGVNLSPVALRMFVLQFFSDQELETLYFDYFPEVTRDFTAGVTKNRKVLNLISYCHRHGRMDDLVAALARERPVAWRQMFYAAPIEVEDRQGSATDSRNPRQIFISHATADTTFAHQLAADLRVLGYDVWIAPESIRPGEPWADAINRGLAESGIMVLVLTPAAAASSWVQMETDVAIKLERAGVLTFLPLLRERGRYMKLWREYEWVGGDNDDYMAVLAALLVRLGNTGTDSIRQQFAESTQDEETWARLVSTLVPYLPEAERAQALQAALSLQNDGMRARLLSALAPYMLESQADEISPRNVIVGQTITPKIRIHEKTGIELIRIPAGPFLYGSADSDKMAHDDERPQRKLYLPEYWIGRAPVTNGQFARFVEATGYRTTAEIDGKGFGWDDGRWDWIAGANWQHPHGPESTIDGKYDYPVLQVSCYDAEAFCTWAGLAMPTEEQWEKAARGTDGRTWPWGNALPTAQHCNFNRNVGDTTWVGRYSPGSDSPYGCVDMAGNVWEWTGSPYTKENTRALRGGAWSDHPLDIRTAYRANYIRHIRTDNIGFRVVALLSNADT